MYGYDHYLNQYKSNSLAAISLHNSSILDFIRSDRFSNCSEKDMNSKYDLFTYINIEQISNVENPLINYYAQSVNLTEDKQKEKDRIDGLMYNLNGTRFTNPNSFWKDNFVTTYMPFIGNCKFLGNHISFKDFMKHPKCNLTAHQVK